MTLKKSVARKIARDAAISLFIYALPVILMFAFFYFTGQKPWLKKANTALTVNEKK